MEGSLDGGPLDRGSLNRESLYGGTQSGSHSMGAYGRARMGFAVPEATPFVASMQKVWLAILTSIGRP